MLRTHFTFRDFLPAIVLLILLTILGVILWLLGNPIYWPGFIAMMVFYALIFSVGAFAAKIKRPDSTTELMLAGRSLPLVVGIFTLSATWVGGGYINGTAESTYASGLAWVQAPWGYAMSLILGGIFFARKMRRYSFSTLIDPLEQRYGKKMAAILTLPAITGELFWTAAILTALGTTFGTVLGMDFGPAIIASAVIAIAYTAIGGLWAVAMTDVIQLLLLLIGLIIVIPVALEQVGGFTYVKAQYFQNMGEMARFYPPWEGWKDDAWGNHYWNWWDSALLLVCGGIPWQVYFQRVLASKTPQRAMWLSILAGFICLGAAIPAVIIGMIGQVAPWETLNAPVPEDPALILPYVVRYLTNPVVATIGLGAIAGAVMSSVDSSILSASSMTSWNIYRPLFKPDISTTALSRIIRRVIWIIGISALLIALQVKSVYTLWYLCSDLVYCILFPQLVTALFDKKANRSGALAGLIVSFILRIGGGEPALGIPIIFPYPMIEDGAVLFPFRTLAMVSGLITIIVVSRLTQKKDPPRQLYQVKED